MRRGEELILWVGITEINSNKGGYENMRKEAVQVAAVALAFIECLDKNKEEWEL